MLLFILMSRNLLLVEQTVENKETYRKSLQTLMFVPRVFCWDEVFFLFHINYIS